MKIILGNSKNFMNIFKNSSNLITTKQFTYKCREAINLGQISSMLTSEISQQNPNKQEITAIACRYYSVIIRKLDARYIIDTNQIFGKNYKLLLQLDVNKLQIYQIIDIISTFNFIQFHQFIDISEPKLVQFGQKLLQKLVTSFKMNKILQNRIVSYLIKGSRFGSLFSSPHYGFLISNLHKNLTLQQLALYQLISLSAFLFRNQWQGDISIQEVKIIEQILKISIKQNWIDKAYLNKFLQILIVLHDSFKNYYLIFNQLESAMFQLRGQVEKKLLTDYKTLTFKQLQTSVKFLQCFYINSQPIQKISKCFLNSINNEGKSSSIAPSCIMNMFTQTQNFSLFFEVDPTFQQKLFKLLKFLVVGNNMKSQIIKSIFLSEITSITVFRKSYSICQKYLEIAMQVIKNNLDIQKKHEIFFTKIYQIIIINQRYDLIPQLIRRYEDLRYQGFMLEFLICSHYNLILMMQKNGLITDKIWAKYDFNNFANKIKGKLKSDDQVMYFAAIIKQIMVSITLTLQYSFIFRMIEEFKLYENILIMDVIVKRIMRDVIPARYHKDCVKNLLRLHQTKQKSLKNYLYRMHDTNTQYFKRTPQQAQLYFLMISGMTSLEKLKTFSNNHILKFLTIFQYDKFLSQIQNIFKENQKGKLTQKHQFIVVRILSVLYSNSQDYQDFQKFVKIVKNVKFVNHQFAKSFFQMLLNSGVLSQKQVSKMIKSNASFLQESNLGIDQMRAKYNIKLNQCLSMKKYRFDAAIFKNYAQLLKKSMDSKIVRPTEAVSGAIRTINLLLKLNPKSIQSGELKELYFGILNELSHNKQLDVFWLCAILKILTKLKWDIPALFQKTFHMSNCLILPNGHIPHDFLITLINYQTSHQIKKNHRQFCMKLTYVLLNSPEVSNAEHLQKYMNSIKDFDLTKQLAFVRYLKQNISMPENTK